MEPYSGTGRDDDLTYEVTVDATVLAVATLPSARRRGVGGALTAFLAQHAIANGVDQVLLSAQDEDVARAWERVGFRRVGSTGAAEQSDS